MYDLMVRAVRIVVPGAEIAGTVGISGGRIVAIEPFEALSEAAIVVDLRPGEVLLPGLVDSHVHLCEPGNTEREDFASATAAAAAGGITTLIDMPIDSIPSTVSVEALESKRRAAEGRIYVDVGFWGGVIPGNREEVVLMLRAGVMGIKCFLGNAGTPDFPSVSGSELTEALRMLQDSGRPLLVHAEVASDLPATVGTRYADYLRSRPDRLETRAVAEVVDAVRSTGGIAHVVHISSADSLPLIAAARRDGLEITAETCPHYLTLCAEEIADAATEFKASPPIRGSANRELLWQGLADGLIDQVVSDHSPATPAMKDLGHGDFGSAWGGISSLQLSLAATWTGARRRGLSLVDIARLMADQPARLAGLSSKGRIAIGYDADLVVFAPDEAFKVNPANLHHRQPITPYAGRTLTGVVRQTFLRGRHVDVRVPGGLLLSRGS